MEIHTHRAVEAVADLPLPALGGAEARSRSRCHRRGGLAASNLRRRPPATALSYRLLAPAAPSAVHRPRTTALIDQIRIRRGRVEETRADEAVSKYPNRISMISISNRILSDIVDTIRIRIRIRTEI